MNATDLRDELLFTCGSLGTVVLYSVCSALLDSAVE